MINKRSNVIPFPSSKASSSVVDQQQSSNENTQSCEASSFPSLQFQLPNACPNRPFAYGKQGFKRDENSVAGSNSITGSNSISPNFSVVGGRRGTWPCMQTLKASNLLIKMPFRQQKPAQIPTIMITSFQNQDTISNKSLTRSHSKSSASSDENGNDDIFTSRQETKKLPNLFQPHIIRKTPSQFCVRNVI
ncbi:hypothetical protein TRFO_18304 [Tritrichomonas foetus]|uniref:Uncharacterized protein n=1 Tax=Tritrichomonas foetus TaxID=1144522 RepID=A0A1J4KRB7_9EUKA|nr:hypothetical protein TRFO_18304 [Tritrichomonas foetus]|eukprot:OHT12013.1 hypothetical protein TRFO_18304 [Tritrichomonas foetus]